MAQARVTTTERVIAAAAQVFLEKGYQGSTIADIAEAANISKPTVYQYAKNKQWLLERIVALVSTEMEKCERVLHEADAPASVRLHWLIQLHVDFAVRYRNSYRVTLSEQADLSPEARDEFRLWARRTTNRFADLLAAARRDETFDWPGDISIAANLILSTLTSIHRWFHPDGRVSSAKLVDDIVRMFSGIYTAPDMGNWSMPVLQLPAAEVEYPESLLTV
ncbi:TetR/AcrR family transcriptional regulator [Rhodococcus sp. T2V]|uniref:TetR/AcrR family transcriptional regulator n=1 Tax=Rhodococcus sp. T2V TaxID=3034164 RepID=UPI0023E16349|nr:TetR/AcrR family transcriptional regulator [Rhodococcus sp. T2V]MDF3312194.1 TetR/AcrR family transcriptional regulator [Rhodococcus sp. T2V]